VPRVSTPLALFEEEILKKLSIKSAGTTTDLSPEDTEGRLGFTDRSNDGGKVVATEFKEEVGAFTEEGWMVSGLIALSYEGGGESDKTGGAVGVSVYLLGS